MTPDDQATVGFTVPAELSALTARYEMLAEIGRGGMGVVYKARDRQTGDVVAIKVINSAIASDPLLIERFTNELLLARRITHKNVCRVHDLNEFGGVAVISMEFVAGRSLREMLRDVESVSIRQGLKIVRQLIAGLAEAHAQGVVHRDLKPENILIGRDGIVKIMDFGIARLADSRNTATGLLIGTPAYMSPEQAEGRPADARSDIYSLGLVIYEMFCGQPAFTAETPVAVVAKQIRETAVAPRELDPDVPVRVEQAILKCLHKRPDQRFQSVADLDTALFAGLPPSAGDLDASPLPSHLTAWRKSDWGLVAAAVVGLALYFPCFARTSLAPRSQVTFDRAVLKRIAEEHLQRLGVPVTRVMAMSGAVDPAAYIHLARQHGAAVARDVANDPVRYWSWEVDFEGASLNVDHRGRLTSFSREPVSLDATAGSFDEGRRQAIEAIEAFFGQSASTLERERETTGDVYSFVWLGPKTARGLRERYSVNVDKLGVSALSASADLPSGYRADWFDEIMMDRWGLPVAVVICVLASLLGLLNRRRVAPTAPWRTVIAIVAFIGGAGFSFASVPLSGLGIAVPIAVALALGLLFAVASLLGSIALELLTRKTMLYKLDTFASLFTSATRREAAGLAIIRGTAIGLALLGVDACAIWLGTRYFHARLSPVHVGLLGGIINGVAWPTGLIAAIVATQMAGVGLLVAFADALAVRLSPRPWLGTFAVAAFLGASGIRMSMGAVQPWQATLLVLFIDYVFLVLTFRRFDLLTLFTAIGTFAFWWANYTLFVMQQLIGAGGPWTAFFVWGLCIGAAASIAFQPMLRRGYRRFTAAFD